MATKALAWDLSAWTGNILVAHTWRPSRPQHLGIIRPRMQLILCVSQSSAPTARKLMDWVYNMLCCYGRHLLWQCVERMPPYHLLSSFCTIRPLRPHKGKELSDAFHFDLYSQRHPVQSDLRIRTLISFE
jgi:hypothetical protein